MHSYASVLTPIVPMSSLSVTPQSDDATFPARDAMLSRYMLPSCVRPSLCLFVISQCSMKWLNNTGSHKQRRTTVSTSEAKDLTFSCFGATSTRRLYNVQTDEEIDKRQRYCRHNVDRAVKLHRYFCFWYSTVSRVAR